MRADRDKTLRMLKTVRGQIDGLIKMVEDDRYCVDISNQIMASQAILRNVNRDVLHAHLECCVSEVADKDKISELVSIIDKLSK